MWVFPFNVLFFCFFSFWLDEIEERFKVYVLWSFTFSFMEISRQEFWALAAHQLKSVFCEVGDNDRLRKCVGNFSNIRANIRLYENEKRQWQKNFEGSLTHC